MRVPMSWLADHVEVDLPALALADRLTDGGLEIESVDRVGEDIAGVLTARVLAVEPHPRADRLALVRIEKVNAEWLWRRARAGVDLVVDVNGRGHQLQRGFERQLVELDRQQLVLSFWSKKDWNLELLRELLRDFRHLRLFRFDGDVQDRALLGFYGVWQLRGGGFRSLFSVSCWSCRLLGQ